MRLAAACLLVMGCGRFGFAPGTGDGGGGSNDDGSGSGSDGSGSGSDGTTDSAMQGACQTWSTFSVIVDDPLSEPLTDDWLPRISADGLSLIQDEYNGTDFDQGVSRRLSITDPFPSPTLIPGASILGTTEQCGQFNADESRLYVLRHINMDYELWQYAKSGNTYLPDFLHPQQLDAQHYWVSNDELRVYSIKVRGQQGALVQAQRGSTAQAFDVGVDVLVHAGRPGMSIALSPDELQLMVSLPAVTASDDLDVFFATRASKSVAFGPLIPIPELTTAFDDVVGSWSSDLSTAYLNLDTNTEGGRQADVWIATRTCLD